jgi:DCN1-like protein 1/2
MKSRTEMLREQFKIDDELHKRVYLFTYMFARPEGQRALRIPWGTWANEALEAAIDYWQLLLKDRWDYLDLWIEFLRGHYNRTIPKDTWNLLYDFIQDIGTDFTKYDENGI